MAYSRIRLIQIHFQSMNESQSDSSSNRYQNFMENLETMGFIIKETISMDQMMGTLERIYSRDIQKIDTDKEEAKTQVLHNIAS